MLDQMLDQLTVENLLEKSFQVETFHSVKATNEWLLSRDNIKILSLQITNRINKSIGKLIPHQITILYQLTREPNDFYYGVSDGIELCYDGAENSIEELWNEKYPKLRYVMDQEECWKGYHTYRRKYYVLYEVPHAGDGCEDAIVNTVNIFRDKNDSGHALRRRQIRLALQMLFWFLFTGIWFLATNDYFTASQAVIQACKILMFYFDATMGVVWISQTVKYINRRRRR